MLYYACACQWEGGEPGTRWQRSCWQRTAYYVFAQSVQDCIEGRGAAANRQLTRQRYARRMSALGILRRRADRACSANSNAFLVDAAAAACLSQLSCTVHVGLSMAHLTEPTLVLARMCCVYAGAGTARHTRHPRPVCQRWHHGHLLLRMDAEHYQSKGK